MDIIEKIKHTKKIGEILPELSANDIERAVEIAADSYYNSDVSLLSDENYDILIERLKMLRPKSSVFSKIGAPVHGTKVQLPYWMGSLDKIKTDASMINRWTNKYPPPYLVSDKLDGISCLLTWQKNRLRLYTRGNGTYGKDITHLKDLVNLHASGLANVRETVAIRGELIMSKANFKKYANTMANARNMVAGIVNSKPTSVVHAHARDVDFVVYELITPNMEPSFQMSSLKKWGMDVVHCELFEDDIDLEILEDVLKRRKRQSRYEIDGLVVTDDHEHVRNRNGNPDYSFAFKGLTETADVKVTDVLWTESKDGILVPRIRYQPVKLSQATLEYTAGFNARFIENNGIGIGTVITLIRSGDVIPYIINIVKKAKKIGFPKNVDYVWDDNHVNIVVTDPDKNTTVIIRRLTKFVNDIGVENMSEGIISRLVAAGEDDIFKIIAMQPEDYMKIDGFKQTLANKIYRNFQTALQKIDLLTLMVASNAFGRGFGAKKIRKILDVYPDIVEKYSAKSHKMWEIRLMALEGFEKTTTGAFLRELPKFQKFYRKFIKLVPVHEHAKKRVKKSGVFNGLVVAFTGFRNPSWQEFIEREGGRVATSVSGKTSLLVYKDGEESSGKYQRAVQLGIPAMSQSEFSHKYRV